MLRKKRYLIALTAFVCVLAMASAALASGYLANSKSGKYHISTCRTIKHPNAAHFIPYNSAAECEAAGYEPCRVCM